jgi:hypothetical protein
MITIWRARLLAEEFFEAGHEDHAVPVVAVQREHR